MTFSSYYVILELINELTLLRGGGYSQGWFYMYNNIKKYLKKFQYQQQQQEAFLSHPHPFLF